MRGFLASLGVIGISIVAAVLLLFGAGAVYLAYTNTLGVAQQNAERNVTTHTQQYVQTQQQVILSYYADYQVANDDAHKNAARLQLCSTAAMLDPNEYPAQAQPFIAQNCN